MMILAIAILTIVLQAQNLAPVANAGPDQTATFPDGVILNGEATDDGQPGGNNIAVYWRVVEGPIVQNSFADSSMPRTSVSFPVPGVYVLRMSADDGVLVGKDDVTVTVLPPVDIVPPIVRINSPIEGSASVDGPVQVHVWASDNEAVASIKMQVGSYVVETRGASLESAQTLLWAERGVALGNHTITVTACDASLNCASQKVTVWRK